MWALRPVRASCGTLGGSFSAVWTRRTSPAMLMRPSGQTETGGMMPHDAYAYEWVGGLKIKCFIFKHFI